MLCWRCGATPWNLLVTKNLRLAKSATVAKAKPPRPGRGGLMQGCWWLHLHFRGSMSEHKTHSDIESDIYPSLASLGLWTQVKHTGTMNGCVVSTLCLFISVKLSVALLTGFIRDGPKEKIDFTCQHSLDLLWVFLSQKEPWYSSVHDSCSAKHEHFFFWKSGP